MKKKGSAISTGQLTRVPKDVDYLWLPGVAENAGRNFEESELSVVDAREVERCRSMGAAPAEPWPTLKEPPASNPLVRLREP
jgi:hypothetical protein